MTDKDQRQNSLLAVWLVSALVILPVTYIFSTGPAVWLRDHGYISKIR